MFNTILQYIRTVLSDENIVYVFHYVDETSLAVLCLNDPVAAAQAKSRTQSCNFDMVEQILLEIENGEILSLVGEGHSFYFMRRRRNDSQSFQSS